MPSPTVASHRISQMNRPPLFVLGLFGWLALELAAFMAVVQAVGVAGALFLGFATSLAGFVLLRQTGTSALDHLRSAFSGGPQRQDAMFDGLIRAVAAFLLILPGFISDLAGLALAAPSLRQMLARRFGGAAAPTAGYARREIVDLAPEEWTSFDRQPGPVQH
jgi:UPF0716 protein FxsA